MDKIFRGIWIRNTIPSKTDWRNRETGELIVDNSAIIFNSKSSNLVIKNIDQISIGLKGSDIVNAWIEINYFINNSKKSIYLCDGKLFGFSGILGGTKRIANFISKQFDLNLLVNLNYFKVQLALLFVLILLFVKLFYI